MKFWQGLLFGILILNTSNNLLAQGLAVTCRGQLTLSSLLVQSITLTLNNGTPSSTQIFIDYRALLNGNSVGSPQFGTVSFSITSNSPGAQNLTSLLGQQQVIRSINGIQTSHFPATGSYVYQINATFTHTATGQSATSATPFTLILQAGTATPGPGPGPGPAPSTIPLTVMNVPLGRTWLRAGRAPSLTPRPGWELLNMPSGPQPLRMSLRLRALLPTLAKPRP